MRKLIVLSIFLVLGLIATGCSGSNGLARLEGEIYWTDGGDLSPGSTINIQIVNASLADVSDVLTATSFEVEGSSPIQFFMEYDASAVDERVTYTASVRIEDPDGTLLYITQTAQPVINQGEVVDPIRILVEAV